MGAPEPVGKGPRVRTPMSTGMKVIIGVCVASAVVGALLSGLLLAGMLWLESSDQAHGCGLEPRQRSGGLVTMRCGTSEARDTPSSAYGPVEIPASGKVGWRLTFANHAPVTVKAGDVNRQGSTVRLVVYRPKAWGPVTGAEPIPG